MPAIEGISFLLISAALLGIIMMAACGGQADPAPSRSAPSGQSWPSPVQVTSMEAQAPGPSEGAIITATCPPRPPEPVAPAETLDAPASIDSCRLAERARMHLDEELANARQLITTLEHVNAELRHSLALEREQLAQMRLRLMSGLGIALQ